MEHLKEGIAHHFPRVPWVVEHHYDHGTFDEFPTRAGWRLEHNNQWRHIRHDQAEAEGTVGGLLQAWLFFGLLAEVISLEPPIDLAEFSWKDAHGSWWITTKPLPRYLKAWRDSLSGSWPSPAAKLVRAQQALDRAHYYISRCCSVSGLNDRELWDVDPMIALSLLVLGETLSHAMHIIIETDRHEIDGWLSTGRRGWGYSSAVIQRMNRDRWCPHSMQMLLGILQQSCSGLLYATRIGQAKDLGLDHSTCVAHTCEARKQVSVCTHSNLSRNGCLCEQIGPDIGELTSLIRNGDLVVLRYNPQDANIECVPYRQGLSFTIISHVWADGFGNRERNTIPACKLHTLLDVFGRLSRSEQALQVVSSRRQPLAPVYFWIDTLAIPVGTAYLNERRGAIRNMHLMYSLSTYTVVLDAGLMSIPRGCSYIETAMKLTTSRWITRLWTLQEAYLSRKLLFCFSDAIQDMDILETIRETNLVSPLAVAARSYHRLILGHVTKAVENTKDGSINPGLLTAVWDSLQRRTTSHAEHETLAIASLLGVDTTCFDDVKIDARLDLVRTQARLDQKMRFLLSMIAQKSYRALPVSLIFLAGPNLSEKGFRWAPRSWLYNPENGPQVTQLSPQKGGQLTADGLSFESPGFKLHRLGPPGMTTEVGYPMHFPIDNSLKTWMVLTPAEQCRVIPSLTDSVPLAIITPSWNFRTDPGVALLVIIVKTDRGVIYAEVVSRVRIHTELEETRTKGFIKQWQDDSPERFIGEVLTAGTQWCVDGPEPDMPKRAETTQSTWFSKGQMLFTMWGIQW